VLPRRALLLPHLCFAERMIQGRDQLRALASEGITRPASISDSMTRLLHSRRSMRSHNSTSVRYGADCRPAMMEAIAPPDIAHRTQPEPDPPISDDRELVAGLVHVGCEDLQVELASLVDVLHDAIGVADSDDSSAAMNSAG